MIKNMYISKINPNIAGMVYKFIQKENSFIHTMIEGELLYKLGFTPKDIIGKTLYDFYPSDYANSKIEFYRKAWSGENIHYESTIDDTNYLGSLKPILDKGKIVAVVGTCLDITEQKKLEKKVRKNENLAQSVLNTMSEGICIIQKNGRMTNLNDNVEKILGVKSCQWNESMIQEFPKEFVTEDGRTVPFSELPAVRTIKEGVPVCDVVLGVKENEIITKWISVNAKPLKLSENEEMAALLSFHDITLQKEQELKLMDSYDFQKTLLDVTDNGFVATDRDKRITLINKRALEVFNLKGDIDSYKGQHICEISPFFNEESIIEKAESHPNELNTKDGNVLEFSLFPFSNQGTSGNLWEFQDITEQKKIERAIIEAKEDAEKANRAKSDFLSKMSHELRTPLNGVLGFAQLLELDDSMNKEQQECVQEILAGGRHLLSLINEILDLSKIESGHLEINYETVDFQSLLKDCIKIVQPVAMKKHIIFKNEIDNCQQKIFVISDPLRLKQVLINLLENAIKYNRANGEVKLSCYSKEKQLEIHIMDTGLGINSNELNKVFLPFYRIAGTNQVGVGIGLAIVKQLITVMNGQIGVSSQEGKGSDFWFTIPIANTTYIAKDGSDIRSNSKKRNNDATYCVLYIEDNYSNISLMQNILNSKRGYRLLCSKTGYEGVKMASKENIDLILLDMNLLDIHGNEVFDILKSQKSMKDIPIIAVSANAMAQDFEAAIDKGFTDYITKPIDIQELLFKISDAIIYGKSKQQFEMNKT